MAVQAVEQKLLPLYRSFQSARRRFWWERAIRAVAQGICASLTFALVAAALALWQVPEAVLRWFWIGAAAALPASLLAAALLRPSRAQSARAVDYRLGLHQQLGTAEELLARRAEGQLVSMQLSKASAVAGEVRVAKAFPLVPRRELSLALLLALFTGALLVLVSLGFTLPNPFSLIRLPSFSGESPALLEQEVLGIRREMREQRSRSPALEPVRQMLSDLQSQSAAGSLSPVAAAAALAQASSELNRVADESRMRQQALDNLANELRGTAAGRDAAQSLRQGDYDRAAEQLKELGQQSDQLSPAAKRELAEALRRAAERSQGAQELARSETRAAESLQRGDYSSTVESMDQLAGSVQQAARQMVPQNELADAWQQLEQMSERLGMDPRGGQGPGQISPPVAQSPQAAGERSGELGRGNSGDRQAGSPGAEEAGLGDSVGPPGSSRGSPGNSPGGPALGEENPRLGPDGSPLDIEGQAGDRFPGEPGSGSEPPSVLREGKADSVPTGEQGASGPISVPAENVFVPGDRRPIVRDYFSGGSGER